MTQEQISKAIKALNVVRYSEIAIPFSADEWSAIIQAHDSLIAAHARYAGGGEAVRKDYMRRLIKGVRDMIEDDPDTIKARKELGDEVTIGRWIDAKILCNVIEEDVLYTHPAPAVPDGYVKVPVEPTRAMLDAAIKTPCQYDTEQDQDYINMYKAMIAASKEND